MTATTRRLPDLPKWSLRGYDRRWLRADVIGGVSTGAVVLPQAMAYATIAGLPVEYGLYTCMLAMLLYALLGGSRTMSVSTTSTIAVLVASTLAAAHSTKPASDLMTLTILVGLFLLLCWAFRLGGLIENISTSVLTGVKVGVGLTVAVLQLPKILGLPDDPAADDFFSGLKSVFTHLGDANTATIALSAGVIAVLLVVPRVAPRLPGPLIVVAGSILLVAWLGIDADGVALIPEVPRGLPSPVAPGLEHVGALLPGALAIALMSFLETVSVARAIRRADEPAIDSDSELFATGIACLGGSVSHALPSAGGFSQSAVSQRSGARTQLNQMVTVVLALLTAFFLAPVLSDLPQATLGAMVIVATLGLIKIPELERLWRISRSDFWLAANTAAVGLVAGLLPAVAVGVAGTLLLVLRELNREQIDVVARDAAGAWQPVVDPVVASGIDVLTLRLKGPLYTANVRVSADRIKALCADYSPTIVIVDARAQGKVGITVLDAIGELDHSLEQAGTSLWIAGLPLDSGAKATRTDWWPRMEREGRLHDSLNAAVTAAREA